MFRGTAFIGPPCILYIHTKSNYRVRSAALCSSCRDLTSSILQSLLPFDILWCSRTQDVKVLCHITAFCLSWMRKVPLFAVTARYHMLGHHTSKEKFCCGKLPKVFGGLGVICERHRKGHMIDTASSIYTTLKLGLLTDIRIFGYPDPISHQVVQYDTRICVLRQPLCCFHFRCTVNHFSVH